MSKILFICPEFGEYHTIIRNTIERSGRYDKVYYMNDCPLKVQVLYYIINNLFKQIGERLIVRYNNKIFNYIVKNDISHLFIIKGKFVLDSTLKKLLAFKPSLDIVIYQWDSISNNKNALALSLYAKTFSFDYDDTAKDSCNITYLPLFSCFEEARLKNTRQITRHIDFSYIGGNKKSRIPYIIALKENCFLNNYSFYFHNYENFWSFCKHLKMMWPDKSLIKLCKLPFRRYYEILSRSRFVLDIPSEKQSGLTMRTMEALSVGCRLITTNKNIKQEPFYNEESIFIISGPKDFKSMEFKKFIESDTRSNNVKGVLTLSQWLNKMGV